MFLQSPAEKLWLLDAEYGLADLGEEPEGIENLEDEWIGSKLGAVDYEDAVPVYSPSLTIVALSCAHAYTIYPGF